MQPTRDSGHHNRINIRLDWEGNRPSAEGIRVIFLSQRTPKEEKRLTYLPAKGGEMKVPRGIALAVIYNYDTEVVQVKGEDSYETIMACTGNRTGLGNSETENMVWGRIIFLCGNLDDVEIGKEKSYRH